MARLVCLGIVLGFAISAAHAQSDVEAAREHAGRARRAYDMGRFDMAAKEYQLAYEAKDDPVLLYNLAQSHRLARHINDAIAAYRGYLRNSPDAANRAEVEQHIHELQAVRELQSSSGEPVKPQLPDSRRALSSEAVTTTAASSQHRPLYKKWWFWTVSALAAGAAATAIGVGVSQSQRAEVSYQVRLP